MRPESLLLAGLAKSLVLKKCPHFYQEICFNFFINGVCKFEKDVSSTGAYPLGGPGRPCPSPPPPYFNFQTKKGPTFSVSKIRGIAFCGVQKLYGLEISRFLRCVLQLSDNLQQLCIFPNYVREIDHLRWNLLRRSDT